MKPTSFLLLAAAAAPLAAQTSAPVVKRTPSTATHAGSTIAAAPACAKLPEISPKVPAVPAGSSCAKVLFTLTTQPNVKLEYVSPLEGAGLRETLGIESSTFSLAYIDTKVGSGPLALPHKWYSIHYTGYLTDGTKFDSSVDRGEPITINYGQHMVIPGWDTGFDGMHIGGKRRLFIPFQLAYGPNGKAPIPPKAELIFDVELVAQSDEKPEPPAPKTPPPAPPTAAPQAAPAADPAKPAAAPPASPKP